MACNKRVIVSIMVLIMLVLAEAQVDLDIGYRSTKRCAKECGLTCLPLLLPKLVAGCLGVCMLKCKFIPWQVVYNCTSACTKTKVDGLSLTSGVQDEEKVVNSVDSCYESCKKKYTRPS